MLVFLKDARLEWRTREIATSMVMLSVLFVVIAAAVWPHRAAVPAIMWMTYTFAAALGFSRAFAWERDEMAALRLAPVDAGALFVAKAGLHWLLLVLVQAASLVLLGAAFTASVWRALPALAAPLLLGGLALAATGTLIGALLHQAHVREILMPLLLLPLALPAVFASVTATAGILDNLPLAAVGAQLQLLGAFDILMVTAGMLLFDAILDD